MKETAPQRLFQEWLIPLGIAQKDSDAVERHIGSQLANAPGNLDALSTLTWSGKIIEAFVSFPRF